MVSKLTALGAELEELTIGWLDGGWVRGWGEVGLFEQVFDGHAHFTKNCSMTNAGGGEHHAQRMAKISTCISTPSSSRPPRRGSCGVHVAAATPGGIAPDGDPAGPSRSGSGSARARDQAGSRPAARPAGRAEQGRESEA